MIPKKSRTGWAQTAKANMQVVKKLLIDRRKRVPTINKTILQNEDNEDTTQLKR